MTRSTVRSLAALTLLVGCILSIPAYALVIAPSPISQRVAGADAVVVGKVVSISDKAVKGEMFDKDERDMLVATVRVDATYIGKGSREVKVGFFPPPKAPVGGGIKGRPIRPGGFGSPQLSVGQEACLFLTKHPTQKDTYVVQMYFDVINKANNSNFKNETEEAQRYAKALANAEKGLKSKNDDERFTAAALLITRYKTGNRSGKTEPVPAAESKLILEALAAADWSNRNPRDFMMNAQSLFFRLGITEKDGWKQPRDFKQLPEEAQKWLKANADTFKMTRYQRDKVEVPLSVEP